MTTDMDDDEESWKPFGKLVNLNILGQPGVLQLQWAGDQGWVSVGIRAERFAGGFFLDPHTLSSNQISVDSMLSEIGVWARRRSSGPPYDHRPSDERIAEEVRRLVWRAQLLLARSRELTIVDPSLVAHLAEEPSGTRIATVTIQSLRFLKRYQTPRHGPVLLNPSGKITRVCSLDSQEQRVALANYRMAFNAPMPDATTSEAATPLLPNAQARRRRTRI